MIDELVAKLDAARAAFLDALAEVDAELVTAPGVVGDWSVRDLVVHVAAWDEHGADALALAAAGRGAQFAYRREDTDAMNERFAEEARAISPAKALEREEAAFSRFREAVASLDAPCLAEHLGEGDTIEAMIRYDGPDHYAEHTRHLLAWFGRDAGEDVEP